MKRVEFAYGSSELAKKYNRGNGCWLVYDNSDIPRVFPESHKDLMLSHYDSLKSESATTCIIAYRRRGFRLRRISPNGDDATVYETCNGLYRAYTYGTTNPRIYYLQRKDWVEASNYIRWTTLNTFERLRDVQDYLYYRTTTLIPTGALSR